ncbi:flagellar basal body rod protein FlgB [Candidatus Poribacteria bacterium]|nr:flagellar basal body rod protein FlgB [Candidatus Poribacteria bacterium]
MNSISYTDGLAKSVGTMDMDGISRHDTTTLLEKALPILQESNRILANNIANANTPNFAPTHISFRESLAQALTELPVRLPLKVTHPMHMTPSRRVASELVLEPDSLEAGRNDKSKFDIDREMVALLKNSGNFNVLSSILTKRYQQMREVLRSA